MTAVVITSACLYPQGMGQAGEDRAGEGLCDQKPAEVRELLLHKTLSAAAWLSLGAEAQFWPLPPQGSLGNSGSLILDNQGHLPQLQRYTPPDRALRFRWAWPKLIV